MSVFAGPADWWTDGTDAGRTHIATKGIVQSGLVLNLDAGVSSSYSGSGTTWTDLSGLGNNGTLINGPVFSNNTLTFDGTNDYVNCGNSSSFLVTNSFTLSVWCSSSNLTDYRSVIMRTTSGSWNDGYGIFQYQNVMYFYVNQWNAAQRVSVSRGSFPTRNWVGTYDGTRLRLYENGLLVSEGSSYTQNVVNPSVSFELGRGGGGYHWGGTISQSNFYNRALSAAEIQQNFNAMRNRFGI